MGKIIGVQFREHQEYGQSINVRVGAGGEEFTISISTNNRYSQHMMKALLLVDLNREVYIKPYDFMSPNQKFVDGAWVNSGGESRSQGLSFRQDGKKVPLKIEGEPKKDKDWWKTANKKDKKRFFEDLTEWFVAEVEEQVIPQLGSSEKEAEPQKSGFDSSGEEIQKPADSVKEEFKEEESKEEIAQEKKATPLKMKKALKLYIEENYEDKTLPKMNRETLAVWYDLCLEDEELPWPIEGISNEAEMSKEDINSQLENLIPKNNK